MSAAKEKKAIVRSPCVDICALDDNDICIGCYRSGDEITVWGKMNNEEKLATLNRVKERRQKNKSYKISKL